MHHPICRSLLALFLGFIGTVLHAQETWQVRPSGVTNNLWSVAYATNQWVAVGEQGTILTSPDGISWTKRPSGFPTRWLVSVGYGAGIWIAVGEGGLVLTSPDAVVWTPRISGTTARLNGIAYGGARWIAVAESGELITSTDSANWTKLSPSTDRLRGLLYAYGQFVITGDNGLMRTTIDTTDYAANVLPGGFFVESVAYGRRAFVAVGEDGYAITSTDAVTWSSLASGTTAYLRGITFFNGQFIAVGTGGAILTTPAPGTAWTARTSGTTGVLTAVAASDAAVVAVGLDGIIVSSAPAAAAPVVTTSPRSLTDAVGSNVLFAVTATGSPPLAYRWFFNGQPLAGQTSDRLLLVDVQSAQAGSYSATVSNALGVANSAPATLQFVATTAPGPIVDPSFAPTLILPDGITAAVEQPDGKIVIGGTRFFVPPGVSPFALARLNRDGSLDPSFAVGTGLNSGGSVSQLLLQPDGKIIVGGKFDSISGNSRRNFVRLNSDGSIDYSFPETGSISTSSVKRLFLQSNGRLLVLNDDSLLFRVLPNGESDTSFTAINASDFGVLQNGSIAVLTYGGLKRLTSSGTVHPLPIQYTVPGHSPTFLGPSFGTPSFLLPLSDGRVFGGNTTQYSYRSGTVLTLVELDGGEKPFFKSFGYEYGVPVIRMLPADGKGVFISFSVEYRNSLYGSIYKYLETGDSDTSFSLKTNSKGVVPFLPELITGLFGLSNGMMLASGTFSTFDGEPRPNLVKIRQSNALAAAAPVLVSTTPESAAVRTGTPVSLSVVTSGSAPLTYKWTIRGSIGELPLPSADTASEVLRFFPMSPGAYTATVVVTNRAGAQTSVPIRIAVADSAPVIVGLPGTSVTAFSGESVTLSATAAGTTPLTYQWFRNGVAVGSGPSLTISRASVASQGDYTVEVTNRLGRTTSLPVRLTVDSAARLANISARTGIAAGRPLIAGFVISGAESQRVLVRGIGPGLAGFGITGTLPDPAIALTDSAGRMLASNNNFDPVATPSGLVADIGGFRLTSTQDSALVATLPPGAYTVQMTDTSARSGVGLLEVYRAEGSQSRLVNLSSRGLVGTGASIAIAGIAVAGEQPRRFLIRGVGPALRSFGVDEALGDPVLTLTTALGATVATNDDWGSATNAFEIITTSATVGAFALPSGSKDAVLLISLAPGNYTALISGANDTTGIALVEVYEVP